MHAIQKDLGSRFGLSFDHFGRSHSPQNHEITQHFYHQLDQNGLLEERTTTLNESALLISIGFVLLVVGLLVDDRARLL